MPELPDIELYRERITERIEGQEILALRIYSPFVLRSVGLSPRELVGQSILAVERLGKRLVFRLTDDMSLVTHLMISGRLSWHPAEKSPPGRSKITLADLQTTAGTLRWQEASPKRRAGIWLARGDLPATHFRAGRDVRDLTTEEFKVALQSKSGTIKAALIDPNRVDGIGNAYSDEILFHAKLGPLARVDTLTPDQWQRLRDASQSVLEQAVSDLQRRYPGFPRPADITAFRPEFAVHGRYGLPCRVCGDPVQRIAFADNEWNYCATCQTDGKRYADRAMSRLLGQDYPRTMDELLARE